MRGRVRLIIGISFIIFLIILRAFGLFNISLDSMRAYSGQFALFVKDHYLLGVVGYMFVYITAIVCSLPLATLLTLLGGFLFGAFWGGIYAIGAATLGATVSFLVVRFFIGDVLQQRYAVRLKKFNTAIDTYGMYYLLMLRLVPIIPFFLINIFSALTTIHFSLFFVITFVGIMPSAFIFSFMGQQLHAIRSLRDVFSFPVLALFLLLGLLAAIPVMFRMIRRQN